MKVLWGTRIYVQWIPKEKKSFHSWPASKLVELNESIYDTILPCMHWLRFSEFQPYDVKKSIVFLSRPNGRACSRAIWTKAVTLNRKTRKYNYFFQSVEIGIFVCCKSSLVVVYVHKLGFKNLAILNVVRGYIFNIPQYSDVL